MKVLFLWHTFEAHFAACWRALAQRGMAVHIVALQPNPQSLAPYTPDCLAGLDYQLLSLEDMRSSRHLQELLRAQKPDVIVVPGWFNPAVIQAVMHPEFAHTSLVMAVDTPYRGTWRQHLGRWRHRRYFSRINRVVVAGERAFQLAKTLGFAEAIISRGMYGIDDANLRPLWQQRKALPGGWPRQFLFVGRYIPEKAVEVLAAAYLQYRQAVTDPWELVCCGRGPWQDKIIAACATDAGFVQPADMPHYWGQAGALILPSRFEPWGQVIVEGSAAGLPILCSEACGAGVEMVRSEFNGRTLATGSIDALANAMRWLHHNDPDSLAEMGLRSQTFAMAYSADSWAKRWEVVLQR